MCLLNASTACCVTTSSRFLSYIHSTPHTLSISFNTSDINVIMATLMVCGQKQTGFLVENTSTWMISLRCSRTLHKLYSSVRSLIAASMFSYLKETEWLPYGASFIYVMKTRCRKSSLFMNLRSQWPHNDISSQMYSEFYMSYIQHDLGRRISSV